VRVIDRQQLLSAQRGVPEGVEKLLRGRKKGRLWRLRPVRQRYSARHPALGLVPEEESDTLVRRAAARVRPHCFGQRVRQLEVCGDTDGRRWTLQRTRSRTSGGGSSRVGASVTAPRSHPSASSRPRPPRW